MSFCELLCASLFNKVRLCDECEGWYLEYKIDPKSGLCAKCHKDLDWTGSTVFDHSSKKLRISTENLTKDPKKDPLNGLTKQYTKKQCRTESQKN